MASTHHYDVIIIGAGFVGRVAAALLTRKGLRVFTLACPSFRVPAALPLSPVIERLAADLNCPTDRSRPAGRFQVITPDIRIDFHGARPLDNELRREFGESGQQVFGLLAQLDDWGHRLETILLQRGKPPSLGLSGRLLLRRRLLFNGLSARRMARKFPSLMAGLPDERARQALLTLFSGLSLADPLRLSIAEAALLWHAAARPRLMDGCELHKALELAGRQHPENYLPLGALTSLQGSGGRLHQITLRDGRRLGASHYVIDHFPDPSLWPGKMKAKPDGASATREHWHLSGFDSPPSHLLAPRVMLAGSPPLLVTFLPQSDQGLEATVQQAGSFSHPLLEPDQLRRRLEPLLPFSRYRLEHRRRQVSIFPVRREYPALFGPKRIGPAILSCGLSGSGETGDLHPPLAGWLTAQALLARH